MQGSLRTLLLVAVATSAAFDGRYVYFVPDFVALFDGLVARYDTHAAFATAGAWSTFEVATLNARAESFWGATFDGRYVYFAPGPSSGVAARFDTGSPVPALFR